MFKDGYSYDDGGVSVEYNLNYEKEYDDGYGYMDGLGGVFGFEFIFMINVI